MTEIFESLRVPVEQMIEPSRPQIIRAKDVLTDALRNGATYLATQLIDLVLSAVGQPLNLSEDAERISLSSPDDPLPEGAPAISRRRWALASMYACSELDAMGDILPVQQPQGVTPHSDALHHFQSIPCTVGNTSSGIRPRNALPELASAYRINPRLLINGHAWFTDPDIFTRDLAALQLDGRTTRTLDEALSAYRHGLYLAACNLLGGAIEGAWYAAGERLRGLDGTLAKALDRDATESVIQKVADLIRRIKGRSPSADELMAHASLMRELRNYGVHPRSGEKQRLERHFTETAAAVLLISSQSHLSRLSEAVQLVMAAQE